MHGRTLKPRFRVKRNRMKRWPKRKNRGGPKQNIILFLLVGPNATLRGLSSRAEISQQICSKVICGDWEFIRADTAQRLARALGVSTDTFLDVLRVYAPKREKNKSIPSDKIE